MDIVYLALDVIEKQAQRLKGKQKRGEKVSFKDVTPLLKALGVLAEDPEIQAEAGKKNWVWAIALASFAGAMKAVREKGE